MPCATRAPSTATPRPLRARRLSRLAEQLGGLFGLAPLDLLRHPVVLVGTPEEMRDEIGRRVETHGLWQLTVNFADTAQLRDFGEKVIPKL